VAIDGRPIRVGISRDRVLSQHRVPPVGRRRCRTRFDSVPETVCGDSSIDTEKRADIDSALTVIAVLAAWWLLQVS
jgi:hypothetical protein